jgi:hypothetical protein
MAVDGNRNVNLFTNLGREFLKELQLIVQQILIQKGQQERNSDLLQSVEFTPENSRDSLYMYVNNYYRYVSKGRRPKMKKIPITALITWIKKKRITPTKYSTNQLAFALQNSIYRNGIRGKNFIELVEETVLDKVETEVANDLELYIADSLFTTFTVK